VSIDKIGEVAMNLIQRVNVSQRVEKTLNAISSSFSEVIWDNLKHSTHQKFIENLERYLGVELISDEEVGSIYYKCEGNLVYTPTTRDADNKVRSQYNKIIMQPELLKEIKEDINRLINIVNSPNERSFVFKEACNIYQKSWQGSCLDYPLYDKKKNSNCLLSILSTLNTLFAFIAGITNYSPCIFLDTKKKEEQIDYLCDGWFSVPAVIMGRETARKAQLPVPERQMDMMDIILNNPEDVATWSNKAGVITGTAIKLFAELSNSKQITCIDYHVDIQVIDTTLVVTAVYPVDKNGYGYRKKGINADSATLCEIQELVNRLNMNLDTSESIKLPSFKGNTFANIRQLSLSHDKSSTQMKLSLTKFGIERNIQRGTSNKVH